MSSNESLQREVDVLRQLLRTTVAIRHGVNTIDVDLDQDEIRVRRPLHGKWKPAEIQLLKR